MSCVHRERKKNLVQLIELNPVQQQPTGNFFILFCHLMTKSGLMTLRELMCHVCIEREKKNLLQLKPVQQQPIGKKNFIEYFNDQNGFI